MHFLTGQGSLEFPLSLAKLDPLSEFHKSRDLFDGTFENSSRKAVKKDFYKFRDRLFSDLPPTFSKEYELRNVDSKLFWGIHVEQVAGKDSRKNTRISTFDFDCIL